MSLELESVPGDSLLVAAPLAVNQDCPIFLRSRDIHAAIDILPRWQAWLDEQPNPGRKKEKDDSLPALRTFVTLRHLTSPYIPHKHKAKRFLELFLYSMVGLYS